MSSTSWMLESAAKGALILAAGLALARLLRRRGAAARHAAVAGAMAAAALAPVLLTFVPRIEVAVLAPHTGAGAGRGATVAAQPPSPSSRAAPAAGPVVESSRGVPDVATGADEVGSDAIAGAVGVRAPSALGADRAGARAASVAPWWLLGWAAVAALLLARTVVGVARVRRIARDARPVACPTVAAALRDACAALGVRSPVRVVEGAASFAPAAAGGLRGVVFLPPGASAWPHARLRAVLTHEVGHLARRDALVATVSRVAAALHWFDPLAWLALARVRCEGERACDALVVASGVPRDAYATTLVDLAQDATLAAALPMARRSSLERRVRDVLDATASPSRPRTLVALVAVLALASAVVALRPGPRALALDAPAAPPAAAPAPYDVALDGTAPFRSVQAAVDAAADGDVVRVGPGHFEGPVRVVRPVTLVGADASATHLVADLVSLPATGSRPLAAPGTPTLHVVGTRGVVVRDVFLSGRATKPADAVLGASVVLAADAELTLERCFVGATQATGVVSTGTSALTLRGCQVGSIGSDGVVVRGGSARVVGCDVVAVVHYGIALGSGVDATVEGCFVEGSLWHGLRYDDASPVVRGNVFARHARSGVYASGRTAATVEENVFVENEMNGISCWPGNRDTLRRNTFLRNRREAVAVLGDAAPRLDRSLFVGNAVAARAGRVAGGDDATGVLAFDTCWFGADEVAAQRPGGVPGAMAEVPWAELAAKGCRRGDPGLDPASAEGASLLEGSAARAVGAGATACPGLAARWLSRPTPMGSTAVRFEPPVHSSGSTPPLGTAAAPPSADALPSADPEALAHPWIADLRSLSDAGRRSAAAAAVRAALAADDPVGHHAAFLAIRLTGDVAWDRGALRELVAARLGAATGDAQVAGFYALFATGAQPGDLDRLVAVLRAPSAPMRLAGSHLASLFSEGALVGPVGDAVLAMLADPDARVRREVLRGLWGTRVSATLEARLVALATDPESAGDAVYFGLSTLHEKSAAVVAALLRAAERDASRPTWGLSFGVSAAAAPAAADALLAILTLRTDPGVRATCLRGLVEYGTEAHAARLRELAAARGTEPRAAADLVAAAGRIAARRAPSSK